MTKILFLIINIFLFIASSSSIHLTCNFNSNTAYGVIGNVYQCEVQNNLNIKSREEAVIESVSGTHPTSKNNDDVISFNAVNKGVNYIPRGLEKFFKNLKSIYIPYGRIKEIRQSDLKPFPNLIYLDFGESDIKFLEDGVFDFNPNLEVVWLTKNKIFHVDPNVFKNLNKLSNLGLSSNICMNRDAGNNLVEAKALIEFVKEKCFDQDFYKLSQSLKNLENDSKGLKLEDFQKWNEKFENLEEEFKNSRFSNLNHLKEKFEILNQKLPKFQIIFLNQINLKNTQIESCSIIDGKLAELSEKISNFDETFLEHKFAILDEKITKLIEGFSEFKVQIDEKLESFTNFPATILKRLQKFESEQKFMESKIQELERKLDGKFAKMDEKLTKVIEVLQARN